MVSVSLKGINGATYEEARRFLIKTINEEARRRKGIEIMETCFDSYAAKRLPKPAAAD